MSFSPARVPAPLALVLSLVASVLTVLATAGPVAAADRHEGVYELRSFDETGKMCTAAMRQGVEGLAIRVSWRALEPSIGGALNTSFIDTGLDAVKGVGRCDTTPPGDKKISVYVSAEVKARTVNNGPDEVVNHVPSFVLNDARVTKYPALANYDDDTLVGDDRAPAPWDPEFKVHWKRLIDKLADAYGTESDIAYWRLSPMTTTNGYNLNHTPNLTAYGGNYSALLNASRQLITYEMDNLSQPMFISTGSIRTSSGVSGGGNFKLVNAIDSFAFGTWPGRVTIWREDLDCNSNSAQKINETDAQGNRSFWWLMSQHPGANAAQNILTTGSGNFHCDGKTGAAILVEADKVVGCDWFRMNVIEIYGADIAKYEATVRSINTCLKQT